MIWIDKTYIIVVCLTFVINLICMGIHFYFNKKERNVYRILIIFALSLVPLLGQIVAVICCVIVYEVLVWHVYKKPQHKLKIMELLK